MERCEEGGEAGVEGSVVDGDVGDTWVVREEEGYVCGYLCACSECDEFGGGIGGGE